MRFHVEPRDVSPDAAARRLGLTLAEFNAKLSNLIERGFPAADPDTGNYDLDAINRWQDARHPHLSKGGETALGARDAGAVAKGRIAKLRQGAA